MNSMDPSNGFGRYPATLEASKATLSGLSDAVSFEPSSLKALPRPVTSYGRMNEEQMRSLTKQWDDVAVLQQQIDACREARR
jgi:hypothetical protein